MKKKLRKIRVNNQAFLYRTTSRHHIQDNSTLTVKVFLEGHKQTPLRIGFFTCSYYIVGQPLSFGTALTNKITHTDEYINLHAPRYIRELILLAMSKGWNGCNIAEVQNGLDYLAELGFDTSGLKPFPGAQK